MLVAIVLASVWETHAQPDICKRMCVQDFILKYSYSDLKGF